MKLLTRMLLLLLAVSLALGLCACDRNKGDATTTPPTTVPTDTPPAPASYNTANLLEAAVQGGQVLLLTVNEGGNTYDLTVSKNDGTLSVGLTGETGMLAGNYAENAAGDVLLYVNAAGRNSAVYCSAADAADLRAAVRETLFTLFSGFDLRTGGDCSAESCGNISFANDKNGVQASFSVNRDKVRLQSLEASQSSGTASLTVAAADTGIVSFEELKDSYADVTKTADSEAVSSMVIGLRTLSRGGVLSGEVKIKNGIFTRTEKADRATITPRVFGRTWQMVATVTEDDGTTTAAMLTMSGGAWILQTEHTKIHAGEEFGTTLKFLLSAVIGGIIAPGDEMPDTDLPGDSEPSVPDTDLPGNGAASDLPFGFAPDGGVKITSNGTALHADVTGLTYQKDETTTYLLSGTADLTVAEKTESLLPSTAEKNVDVDMDVLLALLMQVQATERPEGGALRFDGEIAFNASFASLPIKLPIKYRYLTDENGSTLHLVTPLMSSVTDAGIKDLIGDRVAFGGEIVTDTWKVGDDIFMRVTVTAKYGNPFNPSSKTATSYYRFTEEEFQSDRMTVIAKALNLNEEAIKNIAGNLPSGGDDPSKPGTGSGSGTGSGGGTTQPKPEETPIEKLLKEQDSALTVKEENGNYVLWCDFDALAALAKELDPEADTSKMPEGAVLTIRIDGGDTLSRATLSLDLGGGMSLSATAKVTVLDVTTGTACPIAADQFTYLFPQTQA